MRDLATVKKGIPVCCGLVLVTVLIATRALVATPAPREAPIKIGHVNTRTGPFATLGESFALGLRIALEEVNYDVAGRKIEVISEDDEFKPHVGLTKTRKLVERDSVHVIIGPISSAVALAMRDYLVMKRIPWVLQQATLADLTLEKRAPNMFRTSASDPQVHIPMGRYAYDKLGYKKLVLVGLDYVAGRNHVAAFEKVFTDAGGQVTQKILFPPGSPDQIPFLAKIRPGEADAIHALVWGADAIRFFKQAREIGLSAKMPIISYGGVQEDYLPSYTGEEVVGVVAYEHWAAALDTPTNKTLVQAVLAKTGRLPSYNVALGYDAVRVVLEALKTTRGSVEEGPTFLEALRKVRYESPRGAFGFDACQNAVINIYVTKVAKVGDQLRNILVDVAGRDVEAPGCPVR